MNIYWIVAYLSFFIWVFPPFKQFRTEYFYFFLILALTDVVAISLVKLWKFNPQITYLFSAAFLVISLVKLKKIKIILLFCSLGIMIVISRNYDIKLLYIFYALLSFVILLILLYRFMQYLISNNAVSIFFVFLIAYELSIVLKNIVYYANILQGVTLFSITTLFEIAFGIIFTFVNVNTKVYKLPVKDIE